MFLLILVGSTTKCPHKRLGQAGREDIVLAKTVRWSLFGQLTNTCGNIQQNVLNRIVMRSA